MSESVSLLECPICGASDFAKKYRGIADYEYRVPFSPVLIQCRSCGLLRHERLPTYPELAAFYPPDYLVHNQSFHAAASPLYARLKQWIYDRNARRVARHLGREGVVLDIGCANGAFLLSLKKLGGYELHGLDIKDTGVDFARHSIHFHEGSLEEIDYPPGSFDAVMMDNVIEHVPDLQLFMGKAHSILKPGGFVFGSTPNLHSLDRLVFGKYWGGFHMPRHLHLFNDRNLVLFLRRMGFGRIRLLPTGNSGDWAVSVQNFLQRNSRTRGRFRRAPYFPVVGVLLSPVALLSSLFRLNGSMEFVCRKEP